MKKILCLMFACMLALVFLSGSHVSALGINKIQGTEWLVSTTVKFYTSGGDYDGAIAGGDGIMDIVDPATGFAIMEDAPLVDSTYGATDGSIGVIWIGDGSYKPTLNLLKANSCLLAFDLLGDGPPNDVEYSGPCIATIVFSSAKAFTGSIVIDDIDGAGTRAVIKLKGKKLGQYPASP